MVTNAYTVSAYIEQQLPGVSEPGDMKLSKLVYYAQAWHLAWEGTPLFSDRIEAWQHGPVPVKSYRMRKYGPRIPAGTLTSSQRSVVDAVLQFYGSMSAGELSRLTHEESPWQEARGSLPEDAHSSAEITMGSMRRYYTAKALRGDKTPRHVSVYKPMSRDQVLALAAKEAPKWQGTLTRLAHK